MISKYGFYKEDPRNRNNGSSFVAWVVGSGIANHIQLGGYLTKNTYHKPYLLANYVL